MSTDIPEPVEIPIDGILDEVPSVVEEYLRACVEKGIYEIQIVHGKGKGVLRRRVHALLEKHPAVSHFSLDPGPSGWGATLVYLKRTPSGHAWDENGIATT
jgi:DNA-nicking Smr family endonuclease